VYHRPPTHAMLRQTSACEGGSDGNNIEHFCLPAAGRGALGNLAPHLMIFPTGKLDATVFSADPRSGGPWIMWGGTPYED
jgi:hypothetical protein